MNPTRLPAQIPAAIAARLRQIGTVVEAAETGALYAPLHPREPYANVHVIRDQAYGDDPRHLLDVFTPQHADDTPRPVFIFVHGGGFVAGALYCCLCMAAVLCVVTSAAVTARFTTMSHCGHCATAAMLPT